MDKTLNANAELARIFGNMQTEYAKMNHWQQQWAVDELARVQDEVSAMLAAASGKDGTISRARYQRIQRELSEMEERLVKHGEIVMSKVIGDSSGFAVDSISESFRKGLGVEFLTSASMAKVNSNVVEYVTKRFYADGLVLSDRIWGTSAAIRQNIENEIRTGIITGMSVSEMVPRVRRAFDAETWQIRRLVVTEGSTAYRTATSMSAAESEVVDWVQIHKGRADRKNHMCTILSLKDEYGQGAGIYDPKDERIYNPHPNCTSYLTYIVKDDYTLEGLRKRFGEDAPKPTPVETHAAVDPKDELKSTFDNLKTKAAVEKELRKQTGANVNLDAFTLEDARVIAVEHSILAKEYPMIGMKSISSIQVENKARHLEAIEANKAVVANAINKSKTKRATAEALYRNYIGSSKGMPTTIEGIIDAVANAVTKKPRVSSRTLAWASPRDKTIAYNDKHKKTRTTVNTAGKASDGRWVVNDSFMADATHEFGHMVDFHIMDKFPADREKIIGATYKQLGKSEVAKQLSQYGATNDKELFAEAFSDVHSNGSEATPLSVRLVNEVRKLLGLGAIK